MTVLATSLSQFPYSGQLKYQSIGGVSGVLGVAIGPRSMVRAVRLEVNGVAYDVIEGAPVVFGKAISGQANVAALDCTRGRVELVFADTEQAIAVLPTQVRSAAYGQFVVPDFSSTWQDPELPSSGPGEFNFWVRAPRGTTNSPQSAAFRLEAWCPGAAISTNHSVGWTVYAEDINGEGADPLSTYGPPSTTTLVESPAGSGRFRTNVSIEQYGAVIAASFKATSVGFGSGRLFVTYRWT